MATGIGKQKMVVTSPIVSVVMAVYNGESYLAQAVDSILNQSFTDFEFIVVNDGSTDRTAEILAQYRDHRIQVLVQTNRGLAGSLNRGIRESSGEYIARMDADDISEPDRLKRQVEFLDSYPEYVLVGTNATVMTENGVLLYNMDGPQQDGELRKTLMNGYVSPFVHGSVMFRKSAAMSCGLYNGKMTTAQDLLLWKQLIKIGRMANLPDVLFRYRITPTAISSRPKSVAEQKTEILRRIIDKGRVSEKDARELEQLNKGIDPRIRRSWYELRVGKIYQTRLLNQSMARHHFAQAVCGYPLNTNAWINWLLSYCPLRWVHTLKSWYSFDLKSPKKSI